MSQIVTARFQADAGAVYLPFGFIPDFFVLLDFADDTNSDFYWFWKAMEDYGASGYQDGILVNEGVTDTLASGAGISTYNTAASAPTVSAWSASSSPTARTSTAHGTYVHPTIGNSQGFDVNAIFECVTAGTGGSTEPTWPKDPSGQVTDGTNVWERVDADAVITRVGYQGVAVDFNITDNHEVYCLAIQADQSHNWGDVVGWTGGVYGA
jgi:hypothetical protein